MGEWVSVQAVQDLGEHQLFWYFPNDELMEISFDSDPATWPVLLRSQGEGPEAGPNPLYAAMQVCTTLPHSTPFPMLLTRSLSFSAFPGALRCHDTSRGGGRCSGEHAAVTAAV